MLLRLFRDMFLRFESEGYLQEFFGYFCVDAPDDCYVHGLLGTDVAAQMFRSLRKENLWHVGKQCLDYTEDDLFDVIEYLHDHISKPVGGRCHSYNNCGWHYDEFDGSAGRGRFRLEVNDLLRDYQDGYELSTEGEILGLPPSGLEDLLHDAELAVYPLGVTGLVRSAVLKFRRYHASVEDKHDAVRSLCDVLANNFGIRHRNDRQKTTYDREIWYSWMFYYYLATINASCKLIDRSAVHGDESPSPF